MKQFVFLLVACFLCGCGLMQQVASQSFAEIRDRNRQNLSKLKLGMTPSDVHTVMGTETYRGCADMYCLGTVSVHNPYQTSAFQANNKMYVVWEYYTDKCPKEHATDECLTPVVFEDDRIIGWGREFLNNVKKYELRIR